MNRRLAPYLYTVISVGHSATKSEKIVTFTVSTLLQALPHSAAGGMENGESSPISGVSATIWSTFHWFLNNSTG